MGSIEEAFARMEAGKKWFVDLMAERDSAVISEPLGPEEWSLLQTVEHHLIVERGLLVRFSRSSDPMPERTAEDAENRRRVSAFLRRGTKVPVPTQDVEPSESPDLIELVAAWDKVRTKFRAWIDAHSNPDEVLGFAHPMAGPLNATESLEFLADHLQYHKKRVEQLVGR